MIDTICLLVPRNKTYSITGTSQWDLNSKTDQYEKYIRNPSKAEKETGLYFPRLTEYNRRFSQEANIRIEFSIPKLLYLNNLDEVEENDFQDIIDTLHKRLKTLGIIVEKYVLENASVSSVHFSKNIPLENGYTVSHLISEINKVNLPKRFDFTKTRYINDGQSLYAHTTSHQLVIYDKIADLNKDKKKAIDKDQTLYQRNLFSELEKENRTQEVIRFEVRLSHKQKMNKVFEVMGYEKNPSFQKVFKVGISKKIVIDYWKKLIKDQNLGVFSLDISIKDILKTLFLANKELKPKQAIYLLGLFLLIKDEHGMRQLRTIISKQSHTRTWYRIVQDIKEANELITKNKLRDWVVQIDKNLDEYTPYKCKKL
jgi:hypothetical protein